MTLPQQQLFARGAAEVGSFFAGNLDMGMTRTGLSFSVATTIYDQFQAQLEASASFSLDQPDFTIHGLLQNDFGAAIVPSLTQKVKARANASVAVADDMLSRGLTGWTGFRNNPHTTNFSSRITGFAAAAEWDIDEWERFINAIQKAMNDIVAASPSTPSALLDKALNGFTTAGIPGVETRVCIRIRPAPPFDCLEYEYFCNGVKFDGGACWTVRPRNIGGVCHDPILSQFDIPCSSTAFIEEKLIPPLLSRIDNILRNQNRSPMIVIERAEFTSSLNRLAVTPAVTLATRVRFMRAATRLNLSTPWNFNNQDTSLNALRDALVNAL